MKRRLAAYGIRLINNIVDITNYVMEEFGQPMHAFDLDKIAGRKIIVCRAEDGEKFVTLDEWERTLDSSMLMIFHFIPLYTGNYLVYNETVQL